MKRYQASAFLIVVLLGPAAFSDEPPTPPLDWPQWRGPKADGVADGRKLPLRWSQTENVRWSVKLPGPGTSSPVVHGNRVFITSQVMEGGRKSLLTLCLDRQTGKELWRHDFGLGVDQRMHAKSYLAVNTPAVTKDAVYVAFGNADIACYSPDGKLIWVNRYMARFGDPRMSWGYGLSPLVLDDSVLFPWNHHKGPCFLLGLDKGTGEIAWKKERPIGTAHATPLLVEHHGQKDLLVPGQHRLTAFDAQTHEQLWVYGEGQGPFNGEIISSPVHGDGMVFLQLWRESKIHAIRLVGGRKPPEPLWVSEKPGPVEASLLYYRGLVYALMDNGVLTCLDGKTGKELYRERLGGECNSSPIASDGHIYLSNNDGATFVIKAGKEFTLLNTNQLGERITASPAISGNELIYRTDAHLYCIGQAAEMPWVAVAKDKKTFVLDPSGKKFTPWGFNYDHDEQERLLEDYWEKEWPKVEQDFREMKGLGANVVRIHLQLGKFMAAPDKPNEKALERLTDLVKLAEKVGLYLDLTGLGCYHKQDIPAWYDKLSEKERWDVQARFWEAIAQRCVKSPAVFCYDLMNEPVVTGGRRKEGDWLGPALAGKHFIQFITLDPQDRVRHEIARRWIQHLTAAIRKHDQRHLITVGLVDWSLDLPGLTSGFVPSKVGDDLDFLSVHLYPEKAKVDEALKTLAGFSVGKPVLVEETFPLKCSLQELEQFLDGSKTHVAGWIGFYWGQTPAELRRSKEFKDALMLQWLEYFEKKATSFEQ